MENMTICQVHERRISLLEEEVSGREGLIVQIDRLQQDSQRKKVHLRVLYAALISTAVTLAKPLLLKLLTEVQ